MAFGSFLYKPWLVCLLFVSLVGQAQTLGPTQVGIGSGAVRGAATAMKELKRATTDYQTTKKKYEKALAAQPKTPSADSARRLTHLLALARDLVAAGQRVETLAASLQDQLAQPGIAGFQPGGQPGAKVLGRLPANRTAERAAKPRSIGELLRQVQQLGQLRPDAAQVDSLAKAQWQKSPVRAAGDWFWGGDFGLALGKLKTFVNFSPLVGYRPGQRFSVGGGTVFQYLKMDLLVVDRAFGRHQHQTSEVLVYGGRGFARWAPFDGTLLKNVFLQAEAEAVNAGLPQTDGAHVRHWVPGAMAGLGYQLGLGRGISLNLVASYNFLYREDRSPYSGPLDFRVGVQF